MSTPSLVFLGSDGVGAVHLGGQPLSIDALQRIARGGAAVAFDAGALARIEASHAALLQSLNEGVPVYGVTTGLGAAVDTRLTPNDAEVQRRIPLARAVGIGREALTAEIRAIIAARLSRLAVGHAGISPSTASSLLALLNAGIHPVVPLTGSLGESDLAPLAAIALALIGEGEVEYGGQRVHAAQALAQAEITTPALSGKDGLALVSSNAASVGLAALAAFDAGTLLDAAEAAAALSFEGYRSNLSPLSPRAAQLRPAAQQAEVAQALSAWLDGSDLTAPGAARHLQDPLSFRCAAPVLGAARHAWQQACAVIKMELNSSDDNPAVIEGRVLVEPRIGRALTHPLSGALLIAPEPGSSRLPDEPGGVLPPDEPDNVLPPDEPDNMLPPDEPDNMLPPDEFGSVLPNANFDATHLALSFEHLGLALTRVAATASERIMKLMSPASSGLPRFLTDQPGHTGMATLQKTVSSLMAEISHLAQPMSAVTINVADRVEDYASQAMGIVAKTAQLIERLRWLVAIELIAAAQAVDLRDGIRLGSGTARLHAAVRERVARHRGDRPTTPDILTLSAWLADGGLSTLAPRRP